MTNTQALLQTALTANKMDLNDAAIHKLVRYLELMLHWNKVFNLTSITDPKAMVYLHLIDSLAMQPYLKGKHMLDVGSGAGLPGIPLAIANPEQKWVLVDKNNKKTRFLTQVIAELSLHNVQAVHLRSEEYHPEQCFDSILSRAFGTLRLFVETTEQLLCPDGELIAMKGKLPQAELDDLPEHIAVLAVKRVDIKGLDIERHIVRLQRKK